jgi:hypothetical protein
VHLNHAYCVTLVSHSCAYCVTLVSHSCVTLLCWQSQTAPRAPGPMMCLYCVTLVSYSCACCVTLVSHSCACCVTLVSHSCACCVALVSGLHIESNPRVTARCRHLRELQRATVLHFCQTPVLSQDGGANG